MNIIADTKGRRIATLISLSLAIIGVLSRFMIKLGALTGGLFKAVPLLMFAQFCGGFGAYAIVTLSYTLLSDFCSETFRPKAVVIVNSAWYLLPNEGAFQHLPWVSSTF
jgi:MFS family permease